MLAVNSNSNEEEETVLINEKMAEPLGPEAPENMLRGQEQLKREGIKTRLASTPNTLEDLIENQGDEYQIDYDVKKQSFESPSAQNIISVAVDFDTGYVSIEKDRNKETYLMSRVNGSGNIEMLSDSGASPEPREVAALTETVESVLEGVSEEEEELEPEWKMDPTESYEEMLEFGMYDPEDVDVRFGLKSQVDSHNIFESDAGKAGRLFETLEEIAEYYELTTEKQRTDSDFTEIEANATPYRKRGDYLKWRVTGNNESIVTNVETNDLGHEEEVIIPVMAPKEGGIDQKY